MSLGNADAHRLQWDRMTVTEDGSDFVSALKKAKMPFPTGKEAS